MNYKEERELIERALNRFFSPNTTVERENTRREIPIVDLDAKEESPCVNEDKKCCCNCGTTEPIEQGTEEKEETYTNTMKVGLVYKRKHVIDWRDFGADDINEEKYLEEIFHHNDTLEANSISLYSSKDEENGEVDTMEIFVIYKCDNPFSYIDTISTHKNLDRVVFYDGNKKKTYAGGKITGVTFSNNRACITVSIPLINL